MVRPNGTGFRLAPTNHTKVSLGTMSQGDFDPVFGNEFRLWHFFGLPQNANRPLRWLSTRGEELYAAAQIERSADTHQAELSLAKQLGDLCVKQRWLRSNPFTLIEPVGRKTHGSTKPRLRVDESRKLRAYCHSLGADQHAILTLAYLLLGSRASELVKRDVRDLDDGWSFALDQPHEDCCWNTPSAHPR